MRIGPASMRRQIGGDQRDRGLDAGDLTGRQVALRRGEFRPELAERAMIFASLMPNIKGPEAGRPLRLMPWQPLVFASLFSVARQQGWLVRDR